MIEQYTVESARSLLSYIVYIYTHKNVKSRVRCIQSKIALGVKMLPHRTVRDCNVLTRIKKQSGSSGEQEKQHAEFPSNAYYPPLPYRNIKYTKRAEICMSYLFELCGARYETQLHNSSALIRLHRQLIHLKGSQYPHKPVESYRHLIRNGRNTRKRFLQLMST